MRIKRLCLALVFVLCLSFIAIPASATGMGNQESGISGEVTPMAEKTEWFYRVLDGRLQRRLWSHTYVKWLTDWEYF